MKKIIYRSSLFFASIVVFFFLNIPRVSAVDIPLIDKTGRSISTGAQAHIDDSTGAFSYSVDLDLPDGRNGIGPSFSFLYNSFEKDVVGITGAGWSFSIPYIVRINDVGAEALYAYPDFNSSLDGELHSISLTDGMHGTYGARVDGGSFLQYQLQTDNSWTVTDKNGVVYTFGKTTGSRQDDPADGTRIYKWMLTEVRDTNNNFVRYEYTKNGGQIYPSAIVYTGNGTTDGIYRVEFVTESRTDVSRTYDTGFQVTTNYRIKEVYVKVNGVWTRKYALTYTTGDNGRKALLASLTESRRDESGNNLITLSPYTFSYSKNTSGGWQYSSAYMIPRAFNFQNWDLGTRLADVNGDGLTDVVMLYKSDHGGSGVYLNNGASFVFSSSWVVPTDQADHDVAGTQIADVNGDGLPDLIRSYSWTDFPSVHKIYLNTGTGWQQSLSWHLPITELYGEEERLVIGGTSVQDTRTRIADVNGDGLPDALLADKGVFGNVGDGWENRIESSTFAGSPDVYFAEVNGDGLPDLVSTANQGTVYINKGGKWELDATITLPSSDSPFDKDGTFFFDVNGDGLDDLIRSYSVYQGPTVSKIYINTGAGWQTSTSWQLPIEQGASSKINFVTQGSADVQDNGVRVADINGDGMVDMVKGWEAQGTDLRSSYVNTAVKSDMLIGVTEPKGASETVAYKATTKYVSGGTLSNPQIPFVLYVMDSLSVNDGLGNVSTTAYSYEGGDYYYATPFDRRFTGFQKITKTEQGIRETITYYHQGNGDTTSLGEHNDAPEKIGKEYRSEVYDASGNLYARTDVAWATSETTTLQDISLAAWVKVGVLPTNAYIWWKGDGDTANNDIVKGYTLFIQANGKIGVQISDGVHNANRASVGSVINDDTWHHIAFTIDRDGVWSVYVDGAVIATQSMTSVGDITTAKSLIVGTSGCVISGNCQAYHFMTGEIDEVRTYNKVLSLAEVQQLAVPTGAWPSSGLIMDWSFLEGYPNSTEIPTIAADRNGTTKQYDGAKYGFYNHSCRVMGRYLCSNYGFFLNKDYQVYIVAASSTYGEHNGTVKRYFVRPSQVINYSYDGDGIHKDTAETYTYSTTSGNLIEKKEYGEVMANPATGTFTDVGTDKTKTTYVYAIRNSKETALPSVVHVYGNDEVTDLAITGYYYDNLPLYQTSNGNRTKTDEWINIYGIYYPTTYTYNSYGLVTSETNPRNYTTNYSYDGYNLYPATVTNALSQVTTYTYDYNAGKEKRVTDPNGFVTETTYDGFGRPLLKKITGQDGVTLVTKEEYTYTDTTVPSKIYKKEYLSTDASAKETYSYFDGLERLIQTRSTSGVSGKWDTRTVQYDALGRVWKEYVPVEKTTADYAATGQADAQATIYSYDVLDHVTSAVTALGTTSYVNNDWTKLITDPNNHQKKEYYDARGALVRVDEYGNTGTYTTTYLYDARGNLTRITDAEGNIRNFTYDSLKRQLTNELAHAPASPASTYSYTYDANGNKTQETYPDGHSVSWTYDVLDHVLTETSGGETKVTYAYDTALNGIGKLASVTTAASTKTYTYDEQGNVASDIETIQEALGSGGGGASTDGLVGYWPMDEGSGTTTIDASGNGNNGTLTSGPTWTTGIRGTALHFSDTANVSIPASSSLNVAGPMTISAWIKPEGSSIQPIVEYNSGTDYGVHLWQYNAFDKLFTNYRGTDFTGHALYSPAGQFVAGNWYQVVTTYDGNVGKMYVNGQLVVSQTMGAIIPQTSYDLFIGRRPSGGNNFTGTIDEVRVYNTALTDTDIQALFREDALVGYWTFDDGEGTTAHDDGSGAHDGTLVNGPTWIEGRREGALHFDGVDDYVQMGDIDIIDGLSQITVAAWMRSSSNTGVKNIVRKENALAFGTGWDDHKAKMWIKDGSAWYQTRYSTTNVDDGTWHHVVASYDSITLRIYVDGYLQNQNQVIGKHINANAEQFLIGALNGTSEFWNGDIDDVRIYNVALSSAGVLALFNETSASATYEPETFSTTYTHDNYGALQSVTYPDSTVVDYTYNKLGTVQGVSKNAAAVISNISYGPHGKKTSVTYANGIVETYYYDANKQYRNTLKTAVQGSTNLQHITYTYDNVLNITNITDTGTGTPKNITYTYDNLDRLTGTSGTYTETYTYSPTGNILSKSDVGSYTYGDGRHPYAATSAGANTYTYDLNGNLVTSAGSVQATYAYDHANRLATITKDGETATYIYGNTKDRIQKQGADGSRLTYIGTYAEMDGEGTYTDYFFAGDNRVATFEDGALYYNIQDHLSSSALTTDTVGTVVQKIDHFPFGSERINERTGTFDTHFTFTDQEKDTESGLLYYGARYYNPVIGRFISTDPAAIANTPNFYYSEPQNWNTASYTTNNPVIYVDRDGNARYHMFGHNGTFQQGMANNKVLMSALGKGALVSTSMMMGINAAIAPAMAWRLAKSFEFLGGAGNAAQRAYFDSKDGSIDDSLVQYGGSFVTGSMSGCFLKERSLLVTTAGAMEFEAGENIVLDGGFDQISILGNGLGAAMSNLILGKNAGPIVYSGIAETLSRIQQTVTEISVNIGAIEFINSITNQKSEVKKNHD